MGHRPFHLQGPFLKMLQPKKCYNVRVWKTFVPQTSSRDGSEKKEGAFLTSQEAASSPLHRTLKGGAGKRTKCGWEVSKASEDSRFTDLSLLLAFTFSLGGGRR